MTPDPIHTNYPLILASASPRRKRLLSQVGLPFRTVPSCFDEGQISAAPKDISRILAGKKAMEVCQRIPGNWILGADTVVILEGCPLGKPEDPEDAKAMLRLLSGKEHQVVTGFCVVDPHGKRVHSEALSTTVRFKRLLDRDISGYVETQEPFGKAGSYAIQGIGAFLVERISGSYTNVVGLPVCAVIQALLSVGALNRFPDPSYGTTPPEGDVDA